MKSRLISAYREDEAVLKSLGLELFQIPYNTEEYLGSIHRESEQAVVEIKVHVIGFPALFWRFGIEAFSKEENLKRTTLSINTGSGTFRHYWSILEPLINQMRDGMISITVE